MQFLIHLLYDKKVLIPLNLDKNWFDKIRLHKEVKDLRMWVCECVLMFVCRSPRYPSQWKIMRTPENPESPCCPGPVLIATPPPRSPSPPLPTPRTTRCSGGRACSGPGDWAGRGVGAPVRPRGVRAARQRGSASRDSPCSGVRRGKSSTPWCERGWNTWAFRQLDSVSLNQFAYESILLLISSLCFLM